MPKLKPFPDVYVRETLTHGLSEDESSISPASLDATGSGRAQVLLDDTFSLLAGGFKREAVQSVYTALAQVAGDDDDARARFHTYGAALLSIVDSERSAALSAAAMDWYRTIDDPAGLFVNLMNEGTRRAATGDLDGAAVSLWEASRIALAAEAPTNAAFVAGLAGEYLEREGRVEAAHHFLELCGEICRASLTMRTLFGIQRAHVQRLCYVLGLRESAATAARAIIAEHDAWMVGRAATAEDSEYATAVRLDLINATLPESPSTTTVLLANLQKSGAAGIEEYELQLVHGYIALNDKLPGTAVDHFREAQRLEGAIDRASATWYAAQVAYCLSLDGQLVEARDTLERLLPSLDGVEIDPELALGLARVECLEGDLVSAEAWMGRAQLPPRTKTHLWPDLHMHDLYDENSVDIAIARGNSHDAWFSQLCRVVRFACCAWQFDSSQCVAELKRTSGVVDDSVELVTATFQCPRVTETDTGAALVDVLSRAPVHIDGQGRPRLEVPPVADIHRIVTDILEDVRDKSGIQ